MLAALAKQLVPPCAVRRGVSAVVLPLAAIGVLLRNTRSTCGVRVSATGVRATPARTIRPATCVQCGLFDLFFYLNFSAVRQKNFFQDLAFPVENTIQQVTNSFESEGLCA